MKKEYFRFKEFSIQQDQTAMKVGTDGVLLGAWAKCEEAFTILDIGTGTGLIPLMMAQRCTGIIDAVELDLNAFDQACTNVQNSDWPNRINIFHSSFQEYARICNKKYQLIVSNPPYFTNSLQSDNNSRTLARHNDSLSAEDIFTGVNKLLTKEGSFALIIPCSQYDEYKEIAEKNKLFPKDILWIKPTPTKPNKRILVEFTRTNSVALEKEIVIEDKGRHGYSDAFKTLTKDYYLNF